MDLVINLPPEAKRVEAFGPSERNLKMVREALGVSVTARDDVVRVSGQPGPARAARRVIEALISSSSRGRSMSRRAVLDAIAEGVDEEDGHAGLIEGGGVGDRLGVYVAGRRIEPRSENQKAYVEAIGLNDLVFGVGPAGTGKTYLAVASAVSLLKSGAVRKVILARPAVEAGEKLGFLPGDLEAKVNPYLRPLLDALQDMIDFQTLKRFMASDVIEVSPLAFMRGRTLNDAVVILDEAQNATKTQMKMILTRLGQRSKMIITGDTTQIDLPDPRESGLIDAIRRLRRVRGVATIALTGEDIVRHDLVQRIVEAYGEDDRRRGSGLSDELERELGVTAYDETSGGGE